VRNITKGIIGWLSLAYHNVIEKDWVSISTMFYVLEEIIQVVSPECYDNIDYFYLYLYMFGLKFL